ncbi:WYL domain-containing protein [Prosthecobacter sp.]|uniref:WYL domain-containing protein n=1 Tax=Prosthecobacter sp. TaxID=1965333 RepID=UPI003783805E
MLATSWLAAATPEEVIAQAIAGRQMLQITYANGEAGPRLIEPHLLGVTTTGQPALQAWFVQGASKSGSGPGWRNYLLNRILSIEATNQTFNGPRPGFNPTGGKVFQSVKVKL